MSTSTLDANNVIKKVYDPVTETLKVNAIATLSPGILEITISDTDDSIKVGDGSGNYIKPNPDGSINVSASIGNLNQASDSVAIGDGVNLIDINPDGSINATISATDLDIRELDQAVDNVAIGDGTNLVSVSPNGLLVSDVQAQDKLDDINVALSGTLSVSDAVAQGTLANIESNLETGVLAVGTEDGTPTGTPLVLTNNIRTMILNSKDREQGMSYSVVNNRQQLDYIEYTSNTFPGYTLKKSFTWADFGTKNQRVLNIDWTVL